ncbi:Ddc1 protein [Saccharomycopsis crataegensis]|uniref:Ddc1 protein n=1 Tax=Saccharomycopsis crataegensis TaxID=43959 RepID=A0AAV5QRM0_9ASCO|nr:Ddc1 protein [Saccharomycopsis crataegensis]
MSFKATIKDSESRQIWCKAITSLSTVADTLKFVITSKFISISALNTAKTSSLDVSFVSGFFDKYSLKFDNPEEVYQEGFTFHRKEQAKKNQQQPRTYQPTELVNDDIEEDKEDTPETSTYSFVIQARFLSVIFRTPDDDEYSFSINLRRGCPMTQRFRLLIQKTSKRKVKKHFSPGFQPCYLDQNDMGKSYKRRLSRLWSEYFFNDDDDDFSIPSHLQPRDKLAVAMEESSYEANDPLNYLILDNVIIKKFFEVTPATIEDFQINIKRPPNRLFFIAFLKPVKKDKVYIRQPMSLHVSLALDDIIDSFLYKGDTEHDQSSNDEVEEIKVTFRLKELRTFINLSSMVVVSGNNNGRSVQNFDDDHHHHPPGASDENNGENNTFEIFFARNGSPVIFESSLKRGLVRLKLTELTDVDGTITIDQSTEAMNAVRNNEKQQLQAPKIIRGATNPKRRKTTRGPTMLANNEPIVDDEPNIPTRPMFVVPSPPDQVHDVNKDRINALLERKENHLFVDQQLSSPLQSSYINPKKRPDRLMGKSSVSALTSMFDGGNINALDKEEEFEATVTWNNNADVREKELQKNKRKLLVVDDNEDDNDEGIGRTQHVPKAKGLFDSIT